MDIQYLQIQTPYSFASPFKGAEFAALIYAATENITHKEQDALCDKIVVSGCRYAVCVGSKSSSWEDSVDWAVIERYSGEMLDKHLVMTTSHGNEPLEDIVTFFLFNTSFGDFRADRFIVLLVGDDVSHLSHIQREIEKQLAPQRA